MDNKSTETDKFVDYIYWLSNSHRNPVKIKRASNKIIKSNQIITENTAQHVTAEKDKSPIVRFEEENGVIKIVDITCTCGEKLRLALDYDHEFVETFLNR